MSDLLKCIYANIGNLRFSIQFDVYELSRDQQEAMLKRLDEIQAMVDKVKNEGGKNNDY